MRRQWRRILALALALGLAGAAEARGQARGVVAGRIVDARTALPLTDAAVALEPRAPAGGDPAGRARTARTDSAGAYRFAGVAPGAYRLTVQRIGYRPAALEVVLRGDAESRVSVGLEVEAVALQPLEVSAAQVEPGGAFGRPGAGGAEGDAEGRRRLATERLRQALHLSSDVRAVTWEDVAGGITLGETDLFRALQRLPGVSARDEYSAELWTRGAGWDQTRVYLDGLPLFNPLHALGGFSGVNPDAVGAAFLHPGVPPTGVGGGAAGTLELRTRRGEPGDLGGVGELSLVSGRLAVDGGREDGGGAFLLAARRSYLDWLMRAVERTTGAEEARFPYSFHDLVARVDHALGGGAALEASGLLQADRVYGDVPELVEGADARWGSRLARGTLEAPLGGLRTRTTLGWSGFASRVRERADADSLTGDGRALAASSNAVWLATLSGRAAPEGAGSAAPPWSAGWELVLQGTGYRGPPPGPAAQPYAPEAPVRTRERLLHGALWGEGRWAPAARLEVEAGMRLEAGGDPPGAGALRLAPRLAARFRPAPALSLSAAAGLAWQYAQAVAPAGTPLVDSFDKEYLWVLAGERVPALRSDLATLGAEAWLGRGWLASATAYARRATGVALPDPRPGSALGRPLFVVGENRARGVELSARRLAGRWTASAAYSYGVSEMRAAGLRFPAPAEQRHALDATAQLRLGRAWQLGAAYAAASGVPFTRTFRGGVTCDEGTGLCRWLEEPRLESPGAHRAPGFRSLDLLADWSRAFRGWRLGAYLQLRNVLNHPNRARYGGSIPCEAFGVGRCERDPEPADQFESGLPFLPVVGVRAAF